MRLHGNRIFVSDQQLAANKRSSRAAFVGVGGVSVKSVCLFWAGRLIIGIRKYNSVTSDERSFIEAANTNVPVCFDFAFLDMRIPIMRVVFGIGLQFHPFVAQAAASAMLLDGLDAWVRL